MEILAKEGEEVSRLRLLANDDGSKLQTLHDVMSGKGGKRWL